MEMPDQPRNWAGYGEVPFRPKRLTMEVIQWAVSRTILVNGGLVKLL